MLIYYQHLLVAVDGSQASLHALEEACRLKPAAMTAVAVAPPLPEPVRRGKGQLLTLSLESAFRTLGMAAALAQEFRCSLDTASAGGEPHESIVKLARERGCDLIVMGRKGAARPEKALMGSTVARVIGYSPIDILVVPVAGRLEPARLLLPMDGSRYSKAALERALALARDFQSELLVLSVLDAPPGFGMEAPQVAADILGGLKKLVHDAARKAASQGVACRTWVWEGSVYRSIVELARREQAGLIVLGSHGRTGLKRLLMGSVAERVIGHADCPVLVVKLKR